MLWMKYLSITNNIKIRHLKHIDGEYRCSPFLLDGIDLQNKTIFEIHCFYHYACTRCFSMSTFNNLRQSTLQSISIRHKERIKYIKNHMPDFKLIEIWEHEWDTLCKENDQIKDFIKKENLELTDPINPRDALSGGRTNAIVLYYLCSQTEKIKYIDYTSLYPYVQKYGIYPIGHLEIITENFCYKKRYFGLIKCRILPPRKFYHPVLPAKINKKLFFSLCAKFSE